MNVVGVVALIVFFAGWLGAVAMWIIGAYHMAMSHIQFWQSKPDFGQLLSNMLRYAAGSGVPAAGRDHRRRAIRAMIKFIGFAAVAAMAGFIGASCGGWQNLARH